MPTADFQYKLWGGGGLRSAPDLDSVLVAPPTDCGAVVLTVNIALSRDQLSRLSRTLYVDVRGPVQHVKSMEMIE